MKFSNKIVCLKIVLFVFLLFVCSQRSWGQSLNYDKEYLNWFDQIIGIENTGISNGVVYEEEYPSINDKHKFFLSSNYLKANLNYENEQYFGIEIKYDVFEDEILVKFNTYIQLSKDQISSFSINEHQFTNINDEIATKNNLEGFYEILLNTSLFNLYIKHKKKKLDRVGNKYNYYEFLSENKYYLYYENSYHTINSRKDLIKIFPEFQNEINKYSNKQFRNSEKSNSLLLLMKDIYNLKINETKTITE